jgi:spermidine synthase
MTAALALLPSSRLPIPQSSTVATTTTTASVAALSAVSAPDAPVVAAHPEPIRVAALGVAGGTLPLFLQHYFGRSIGRMDLVDIEPQVLASAMVDMGLVPRPSRRTPAAAETITRLYADDAKQFLATSGIKHDLIFVDTFVGGDVPEHIQAPAFLELCRDRLREGGVAAFNIPFADKELLKDISNVFGKANVFIANVPKTSNVVVFGAVRSAESGDPRLQQPTKNRQFMRRAAEISTAFALPYDLAMHLPHKWLLS